MISVSKIICIYFIFFYLMGYRYFGNVNTKAIFLSCAIAISSVIVFYFAWISEDAFITFRYVNNFVKGYGLVYNLGERVQGYTHPFWMFLIVIGALLHLDLVYWIVILGLVFNAITIAIFYQTIKNRPNFNIAFAIFFLTLYSSASFVDFQTSGLESSLTHCLLMFIIWIAFSAREKKLFLISLGSGLLLFNRLDQLPLIAPIVIYIFFKEKDPFMKKTFLLIQGSLPIIIWEIFSLIYYGFLLPNTYYGKVGVLSFDYYIYHGLLYLLDFLIFDFIGAGMMIIAISMISISTGRNWKASDKKLFLFVIGCLIHIVLVVCIGGDFMRGRMLLSSFFTIIAVFSISIADYTPKNPEDHFPNVDLPRKVSNKSKLILGGCIIIQIIFYIMMFTTTRIENNAYYIPILFAFWEFGSLVYIFLHQKQYFKFFIISSVLFLAISRAYLEVSTMKFSNGMAWERKVFPDNSFLYYMDKGVNSYFAAQGIQYREQALNGSIVIVHGNMGMLGYYAGENVTIIDLLGLTDPFLARSPHAPNTDDRIGHIIRYMAPEYELERVYGIETETWTDPQAQAMWHDIKLITQGELFSEERWDAMFRIWTEYGI